MEVDQVSKGADEICFICHMQSKLIIWKDVVLAGGLALAVVIGRGQV